MRVAAWVWTAPAAAVLAVGLVLWGDENRRERPDFSPEPVEVLVSDVTLRIPTNALRFVGQRRPGAHGRLDLALSWPDLEGRTAENNDRFDAAAATSDIVWISIQPRGEAIDGASRLAGVYARLFVGEPWDGPVGLQGRRLSAKAGYAGEEIFFEPGAVRPFVARCYPLALGEPVSTCIHDAVIGSLLVTWRFRRGLLDDWPHLTEAVGARMAQWGLPARR